VEFGFRGAAITDNLIEDCGAGGAATNDRSSSNGAARRSPAMRQTRFVSAPCLNEMRGSKKANIVAMLQTEGPGTTLLCQARPIRKRRWKYAAVVWRDSIVFSFDALSLTRTGFRFA